jgi:hypothetical protein
MPAGRSGATLGQYKPRRRGRLGQLVTVTGVGQVRTTVTGYSDWGARAAPVNSSCLVTTLAAASV